jgi:putative transcriptional regulator
MTTKAKTKKTTKRTAAKTAKKSSILQTVHETAEGLYAAGAIDKTTMREFDAICLPKIKTYTPSQIKALRVRCKASQAVFAAYLNTTPSSIQKWEIGRKRPSGPSLKLLNIIDKKGLEALA